MPAPAPPLGKSPETDGPSVQWRLAMGAGGGVCDVNSLSGASGWSSLGLKPRGPAGTVRISQVQLGPYPLGSREGTEHLQRSKSRVCSSCLFVLAGSVVSVLQRLWQEDSEFEASLGYVTRPTTTSTRKKSCTHMHAYMSYTHIHMHTQMSYTEVTYARVHACACMHACVHA